MRLFKIFILFFILVYFLASNPAVLAQSTTAQDQMQQLQDQINKYTDLLNQSKGQEKTLQSQLNTIDAQTKITELKIQQTKFLIGQLGSEINTLNGRISKMSGVLNSTTTVLLQQIVSTYREGNISPLDLIFSSTNIANILERLKYIDVIQAYDKNLLYQLQATKMAYNDQKTDKQTRQVQEKSLETELASYQSQLDQDKTIKQQLLTVTQNNEETYQRLLSQAEEQLAAFQNFVSSQGGASLLSNQTVCDGWGCYYNQRDSEWGNAIINGSSGTTIAESGCLMTSVAMVLSHYGHRVTPLDINIPVNFFSNTAYMLYTVSAGGVSARRVSSDIDSTLNDSNHDPVIVGISYDGGPIPDHFVVLVSGSNGNYIMNDPFIPNGHNVNFTDHYPLSSIKEIDKIEII